MPKEWIARWTGKLDQGWDKLREEILARQIQTGMVPKGTALAPKPTAIPDWDTFSAASGVGVAYVFLDLMPDLAEQQILIDRLRLTQASTGTSTSWPS